MDTAAPDTIVRWKSLSGIGLALLLFYGVMNVAAAIAVPASLKAPAVLGAVLMLVAPSMRPRRQ